MGKIQFNLVGEEEEALFYVLEQTQIGGNTYLLVTDQEEGDADCWILRLVSGDGEQDALYQMVEDDQELEAVGALFASMIDEDTTLVYTADSE